MLRICPGKKTGESASSVLYHIGPRRMPSNCTFHGISFVAWPNRVPIASPYWLMRVAMSVPAAATAP